MRAPPYPRARALPLALLLVACESQPVAAPSLATVEVVSIAPANARLLPGGQVELTATPRDGSRHAVDHPVTWTSSDPSRATISGTGVVSAVGAGPVVITAESDGVSGEARVTVDEGGIVGPEGGQVRAFEGRVLLTVPAGAVVTPTEVFVSRPPNAPLDATEAAAPIHVRSGQAFAAPATLTLAYDPAAAPVGVQETALGARTLGAAGWTAAPGGTADPASHTVSAPFGGGGTFDVGRLRPTAPCTAPEFRQFDFWLGQWNAAPPDVGPGARQASSSITEEPGGCAVFEDFRDLDVHGVSISLYDPATAKWYQTFIDNLGGRIVLSGGLVAGAMVLTGPAQDSRITWEALAGDVRQFGEDSGDGGSTWSTSFDLIYRPR